MTRIQTDLGRASTVDDRLRPLLTDLDANASTNLNQRFHPVRYTACSHPVLHDLLGGGGGGGGGDVSRSSSPHGTTARER